MDVGSHPAATVGVVGLGLIGGSIALDALGGGWPLVALDADPEQAAAARTAGVRVVDDLGSLTAAADLVVVATPAPEVREVLAQLDAVAERPLLVTSVASVQSPRVLGTDDLVLTNVTHLGGHPMTGTERSGFRAARRGMFDGSPWIVTATPRDRAGHLRVVVGLALALGATPVVVPPAEHDRVVALLSHLPHVLAYGLYGRLTATDDHGAELLAGGSFRDATRVAATRPSFWSEVLDLNRDAVATALADLRWSLGEVERLLREGGDAADVEAWLAHGHREVGRPRPEVPEPTQLPADGDELGEDVFTTLRANSRAGLAIVGWTADGAATWSPL